MIREDPVGGNPEVWTQDGLGYDSGVDARLSRLWDEHEIKDVIHRYCRGVDRHDLGLVRRCYHSDARDEHGSFEGNVDEFLLWLESLLVRYSWTMHCVANILIEFGDEANVAVSETYGVAMHRSPEKKAYLNLVSGFRYVDRFERREDGWRVAHRKVVSEWSIHPPDEAWWEIPEHLDQGVRGASDALYTMLSTLSSSGRNPGGYDVT